MKKNKSILVTGCAGFIGSNFVKQFKKKFPKIEILGIDNFSSGKKILLDKEITFYEGSIMNTFLLEKIFKKHRPNYVFHFAAIPRVSYSLEYPIKTNNVNINGTVNLLKKSIEYKIKRFIFSSSSSVFGGAKNLPTSESEPPNPQSPYALQKYTGEQFCKIWSEIYNLDIVCLRYFNVFGPGQYGDSAYSTVVSAWLEALYFPNNKKSFIEGDGMQSRDFCYVDNIVESNILAMEMKSIPKKRAEIFNIAYGDRTTLMQVKDLIEKYTGKKLNLEKRKPRLGDVRHTQANINKAKKVLGYNPKYDFENGLIETIKWFDERKKIR